MTCSSNATSGEVESRGSPALADQSIQLNACTPGSVRGSVRKIKWRIGETAQQGKVLAAKPGTHTIEGEPTLASHSLTSTSVILDLPHAVNLYYSFSSCGDSPNYKVFVTMSIIVILLLLENHNANICVFP